MIAVENANSTFTEPKLKNVTIANNSFLNQLSAGPAVNIADTDNFNVSDNYFENVYRGLTIDTGTSSSGSVYDNDVVIDNTGNSVTYTELSGTFNDGGLSGYNGSSTRYSGSSGAKAEWTFVCPKTDNYDVYIYKVVSGNSDTNARITVNHTHGSDVDYIDYTSGSSGWVYLGTYNFSAQSTYTITNERSNNNLRADAVRFVQSSGGPILPALQAEVVADSLMISWADRALEYSAQGSVDLNPAFWRAVTNSVVSSNGTHHILIPLEGSNRFFRLILP
jgi:hypothetical protein